MIIGHVNVNPYSSAANSGNFDRQKLQKEIPVVSDTGASVAKNSMEMLQAVYGERELYKLGIKECETCNNRTYVDGSNDSGVSFKTPGHIAPESSATMVMAHEQEHVRNNQADAVASGGKVLSQSVTLHMDVCPECGRSYVSGGVTHTTTSTPSQKQKSSISPELLKGLHIDERK